MFENQQLQVKRLRPDQSWDCYYLGSRLSANLELCLGYWMGENIADGYPPVGVVLMTSPRAPRRTDVIGAMREIAHRPDWGAWDLDNPTATPGIQRLRSLAELLSQENHVEAIRDYFFECLDELEDMVKTYPILLG